MKLQVLSAFLTLSFPCLCFLLHGTRSCLLFLFEVADYRADTKMTLVLVWCLLRLQLCALTRATCSALWQFLAATRQRMLDCASPSSCRVGQCWQPASCCLVSLPTVPAAAVCLQPLSPSCDTSLPRRGAEQRDAFPIVSVVFFLLWLVTVNALSMCMYICVRLKYQDSAYLRRKSKAANC